MCVCVCVRLCVFVRMCVYVCVCVCVMAILIVMGSDHGNGNSTRHSAGHGIDFFHRP